jgi:hypothetical protein
MKKATSNKTGYGNRKILATKKASVSENKAQNSTLQLQQVSESELKAARNSAYTYLIR